MEIIKEEQIINKYVIATLGNPTYYLVSKHFGNYCFTDNLIDATKTMTRNVAEQMKQYYYSDTNSDIELVVLPLEIKYSLIDESNNG